MYVSRAYGWFHNCGQMSSENAQKVMDCVVLHFLKQSSWWFLCPRYAAHTTSENLLCYGHSSTSRHYEPMYLITTCICRRQVITFYSVCNIYMYVYICTHIYIYIYL